MLTRYLTITVMLLVSSSVLAIDAKSANVFADKLYQLHQKIMSAHDVRTTEKIGGYGGLRGDPEFYNEINYFDKNTGRLLSMIQWERKNPKNIHTIQVNIYDDNGKLVRDYTAAYLPINRAAPFQTIVGIYNNQPTLTGYRQYDAAGELLYESCKGTWEGKKFRIVYEFDEIPDDPIHIKDDTESNAYPECFDALKRLPTKYLDPLNN